MDFILKRDDLIKYKMCNLVGLIYMHICLRHNKITCHSQIFLECFLLVLISTSRDSNPHHFSPIPLSLELLAPFSPPPCPSPPRPQPAAPDSSPAPSARPPCASRPPLHTSQPVAHPAAGDANPPRQPLLLPPTPRSPRLSTRSAH